MGTEACLVKATQGKYSSVNNLNGGRMAHETPADDSEAQPEATGRSYRIGQAVIAARPQRLPISNTEPSSNTDVMILRIE